MSAPSSSGVLPREDQPFAMIARTSAVQNQLQTYVVLTLSNGFDDTFGHCIGMRYHDGTKSLGHEINLSTRTYDINKSFSIAFGGSHEFIQSFGRGPFRIAVLQVPISSDCDVIVPV